MPDDWSFTALPASQTERTQAMIVALVDAVADEIGCVLALRYGARDPYGREWLDENRHRETQLVHDRLLTAVKTAYENPEGTIRRVAPPRE
jgi:hypothetical protein